MAHSRIAHVVSRRARRRLILSRFTSKSWQVFNHTTVAVGLLFVCPTNIMLALNQNVAQVNTSVLSPSLPRLQQHNGRRCARFRLPGSLPTRALFVSVEGSRVKSQRHVLFTLVERRRCTKIKARRLACLALKCRLSLRRQVYSRAACCFGAAARAAAI